MHEMPLRAPLPACATLFGFNTFSMNAAERMFDSGELISDLQFLNCRTGPGAAIEEAPETDHFKLKSTTTNLSQSGEDEESVKKRKKENLYFIIFFVAHEEQPGRWTSVVLRYLQPPLELTLPNLIIANDPSR
jgi:hypothetical protein